MRSLASTKAIVWAALFNLDDVDPQFIPHQVAATLWMLHGDGGVESNAVACGVVVEALRTVGIAANPIPVGSFVFSPDATEESEPARYGVAQEVGAEGDWYFVVWLPTLKRFLDITAADLPEFEGTAKDGSFIQVPVPGGVIGDEQFIVKCAGGGMVAYVPAPKEYHGTWTHVVGDEVLASVKLAGRMLAAELVDVLGSWNIRPRLDNQLYSRLCALIDDVEGDFLSFTDAASYTFMDCSGGGRTLDEVLRSIESSDSD